MRGVCVWVRGEGCGGICEHVCIYVGEMKAGGVLCLVQACFSLAPE